MTRDEFIQYVVDVGEKVVIKSEENEIDGYMANPANFNEDAWNYLTEQGYGKIDPKVANLVIVSDEPDDKKINVLANIYPTGVKTGVVDDTSKDSIDFEFTAHPITPGLESPFISSHVGKMFKEWVKGLQEEAYKKE